MPAPVIPVAALVSVLAAITVTPDPVAFQLGPIPVYWYGVCYAVGLALAYLVITREARRRGLDARLVDNGIIIVAVVALIGGRLYHVIDQWQLYQDDLLKIVMPPYTGLGVYGGILTGTIAAVVVTKLWKQSFWKWTDVIAPGLFVMQAVGRLGNFFNQELYGPPTTLPWGIAIDEAHRVPPYTDLAAYPVDTTFFQPLFLYESLSGIIGAITLLWIARRWGARLRPGDLFLLFLVWYAVVRMLLETLRTGNWTVFGIPTAIVVSIIVIAFAIVVFAIRHRPGSGVERWGDPPTPDEDTYEADGEETVEVEADEEDEADEDAVGGALDGRDETVEVDDAPGDRDGGGDAARPAPGA